MEVYSRTFSVSPPTTCFLVALPAIAADMDNSSAFMPVAVAAAAAAALAVSGCVSLHA